MSKKCGIVASLPLFLFLGSLYSSILPVVVVSARKNLRSKNIKREHEQLFSSATVDDSIHSFVQLTSSQIEDELSALSEKHPRFVSRFTSQDRYNLPSPCLNTQETHVGCNNTIIVIHDSQRYDSPSAHEARRQIPDVLLSTVHGDERVGPVVCVEVAKLLAMAALCHISRETRFEEDCDAFVRKYGMENVNWMAKLVSTRRVVIVPTVNAMGYYNNERWERYVDESGKKSYIDPNRDFTIDQKPEECMRTIAARTLNELFLDHLFQMTLVYHGGTEMISYEWGAISIPRSKVSPDDVAQSILAKGLSRYAGETSESNKFYRTGDMNSILYGINGGMEDWVYSASWLDRLQTQCTPSTYGGYPLSKTTYDMATLSTFNILVEISRKKSPPDESYGTDNGLFSAPFPYDEYNHNGYVSKNIRTALMSIDIVQPYVEIRQFGLTVLNMNVPTIDKLYHRWCKDYTRLEWNTTEKNPKIKWSVGGAFTVDRTWLVYGLWKNFPSRFNCINQLTEKEMTIILSKRRNRQLRRTKKMSGITRWTDAYAGQDPQFQTQIKLKKFAPGDKVAVYAIAVVDQSWKEQPSANVWPKGVAPRSHMVNGRTNPEWIMEKPDIDKAVIGRVHWLSVPLTIQIV